MITIPEIKEMVRKDQFLKEYFEKEGLDIKDILAELEFEEDQELIKRKLDMSFSPKDFTIYFSPKFLEKDEDEEFIKNTVIHEFQHIMDVIDDEDDEFKKNGPWHKRPEEQRAVELQIEYMLDNGDDEEKITKYLLKKFPSLSNGQLKELINAD